MEDRAKNLQHPSAKEPSSNNDTTYFSLGAEAEGEATLEMDLVFLRQKGVEEKFLNVQIGGFDDTDQDSNTRQYGIKIINNKEDFEKIKEFFMNLKWDT